MEKEKQEDVDLMENESESNWATVGKLLLFVVVTTTVIVFSFVISGKITPTNAEASLQKYRETVKTCGEDNVKRQDYVDGSSEFTCEDFEEVK